MELILYLPIDLCSARYTSLDALSLSYSLTTTALLYFFITGFKINKVWILQASDLLKKKKKASIDALFPPKLEKNIWDNHESFSPGDKDGFVWPMQTSHSDWWLLGIYSMLSKWDCAWTITNCCKGKGLMPWKSSLNINILGITVDRKWNLSFHVKDDILYLSPAQSLAWYFTKANVQ